MGETIEQLRKILERERTAKLICAELNNFIDLKPTLKTVIKKVKQLTNCDTIVIRFLKDGDYPYYVYRGFPALLVISDNSLSDEKQNLFKDDYQLECICGNVISAKYDPRVPFYTKNGSYWANNSSQLTSVKSKGKRNTTGKHSSLGYQSVALVPIKVRGERIGLIQLIDKREGLFTEDLIEFIEMIGEQIGLAVHNSYTHTQLMEAMSEIKTLRKILPICASCKKIRDDKGYWHQVEEYIKTHAHVKLTHAICPECMEKLYPDILKEN